MTGTARRRVVLVAPWDRLIWAARRGLVRRLVADGWDVVTISPVADGGIYRQRLEALGARHVEVPLHRFIDPIGDLRYFWRLWRTLRRERPQLVHVFTIKPNTYGGLAARLAGAERVVGLVEGFGYLYGSWFGRRLLFALLRFGFLFVDAVWFINRDDRDECVARGVLHERKAVLIPSVGIDAKTYHPDATDQRTLERLRAELRSGDRARFVVCVGRMTWAKGIRELVEAAKLLSARVPDVRVLLVGEIQDASPDSVPRSYLEEATSPGFAWLGFRSDVADLVNLATVVTLPTFYREGVPLVLMEAMACAKPVVATDWVGCREVVRHGENGLLVPPRDSAALAEALEQVLLDSTMALTMGKRGRDMIEREFDDMLIAERVVRELYRPELLTDV